MNLAAEFFMKVHNGSFEESVSAAVECLIMKILKKTGNYLTKKALKNLALTFSCLIVFGVILYSAIPNSILFVNLGMYDYVRLFILVLPVFLSLYFYGQFAGYKRGHEGERAVTRILSSSLTDEYFLINDVAFPDGYGNIDHVVVGPNGVFVIETKNYAGKLVCYGDDWSRKAANRKLGRLDHFDLGSPSRQTKRNAMRVKNVIDSMKSFSSGGIWIEGILVFANPGANIEIHNPTVPILKIKELPNFIFARKSYRKFSPDETRSIGKEILRQAKEL